VSALRAARQAVGFLTIVGGAGTPTTGALVWFPVVGALVGAVVGTAWYAAASWFPALVAAALAVIVDLALTGMLHVDGLADSADGLIAPMPRERRLEVMSDPGPARSARSPSSRCCSPATRCSRRWPPRGRWWQ